MYPNFDIDPRSESFSLYRFTILIQEPSFLYTNYDIDPSTTTIRSALLYRSKNSAFLYFILTMT